MNTGRNRIDVPSIHKSAQLKLCTQKFNISSASIEQESRVQQQLVSSRTYFFLQEKPDRAAALMCPAAADEGQHLGIAETFQEKV